MTAPTENPVIRTSFYAPKNDGSGLYTRARWATLAEFEKQVEACLKSIVCEQDQCSAYDAAESVFQPNQYERSNGADPMLQLLEASEGRVFALPCKGSCEGYLIRILFLKPDDTYQVLLQIKYLIDEDSVWKIARALCDALDRGLYI